MPKKALTRILRVPLSKQPPESLKDKEWCHYCQRVVPRGRLDEHKRTKHNEGPGGPAKRTEKANVTKNISSKKVKLKANPATVKATRKNKHCAEERELEDWEVVRDWDAIDKLTHMTGLPQFRPRSKNFMGGKGRICPACHRSIPLGNFATHNCKAITATVPHVRKRSSLPRKNSYVKVKSNFTERRSDWTGGWS
jgi:hypothetical protein